MIKITYYFISLGIMEEVHPFTAARREDLTGNEDAIGRSRFLLPHMPESKLWFNYEKEIIKSLVGFELPRVGASSKRDSEIMMHFLNKVREGGGELPGLDIDIARFMYKGRSLLDFLIEQCKTSTDDWKIPSLHYLENEVDVFTGIDRNSLSSLCHMELIMSITTSDKEIDEMTKWVKHKLTLGQKNFPVSFISFQNFDIMISIADYNKMQDAFKKGEKTFTCKAANLGNRKIPRTSVPARVEIGDGYKWSLSLRLPIYQNVDKDGNKIFTFMHEKISDKWISFFSTLPPIVGVDMYESKGRVELFVSDLCCIKIGLPDCFDLTVLALILGWDTAKTDLFTLNLVTTGTLINQIVQFCDNNFALSWKKLGATAKVYIVGNIKAIHFIFTILMSILLRNVWPDPDILCEALELEQDDSFSWFSWLVIQCFKDTQITKPEHWDRTSRKNLIGNVLDGYTGQTSDLAVKFAKIIQPFIHITSGGPRYLQYVRSRFFFQFKVLQDLDHDLRHPLIQCKIDRKINPKWVNDLTFNRGVNIKQNFKPCDSPGLNCHPDLADVMFSPIKNGKICLTTEHFRSQGDVLKHPSPSLVLEWCRLDLSNIDIMMTDMASKGAKSQLIEYFMLRTSLYQRLQNMHLFVLKEDAVKVPIIYNEMSMKVSRVFNQETATIQRAQMKIDKCKIRKELILSKAEQGAVNPVAESGVSQRIYSMVNGDDDVRNTKIKERKRKKIQKLVEKGVYDPQFKIKKKLNRMLSGAEDPHDLRDKLNDANRESFYQGQGSETEHQYRVQTEQAHESYSEPPNVDLMKELIWITKNLIMTNILQLMISTELYLRRLMIATQIPITQTLKVLQLMSTEHNLRRFLITTQIQGIIVVQVLVGILMRNGDTFKRREEL